LAAKCTLVYSDLDPGAPHAPSGIVQSITGAAKESLSKGQFQIAIKALSADDVRQAILAHPSGHDRLAQDSTMTLVDAGAMLAYAPYHARILLSGDPFAQAESIAGVLGVDVNSVFIRLHDALLLADEVVALGQPTFDAIAPFLSKRPKLVTFPPIAMRAGAGAAAMLLVDNTGGDVLRDAQATFAKAFPGLEFVPFDSKAISEREWKAVLHFGIAIPGSLGARLSDAWAGSVPVLQLVDPMNIIAQRRLNRDALADMVVDHGKTGLLFSSMEELLSGIGDLLVDDLPVRVVARNARRRVDPATVWDAFLSDVLQ
jgi:hypothetical protein